MKNNQLALVSAHIHSQGMYQASDMFPDPVLTSVLEVLIYTKMAVVFVIILPDKCFFMCMYFVEVTAHQEAAALHGGSDLQNSEEIKGHHQHQVCDPSKFYNFHC